MQYWICYDVADDRRRQRLSDVLLDFGTRVEQSVFQCLIDPPLAETMLGRIRHTIEEHADKVHVLALCDSCAVRVVTCGLATQASDPEYLLI